jgi:hypothetical protein
MFESKPAPAWQIKLFTAAQCRLDPANYEARRGSRRIFSCSAEASSF